MSDIAERLSLPAAMSMFSSKDEMLNSLLEERGEAASEITRLTRELEEAKADRQKEHEKFLEMGRKYVEAKVRLAYARSEVLEQAAKVAEGFEVQYASERDKHAHGTPDHWMNNSGSYAAMDIAAAIRALKEKP